MDGKALLIVEDEADIREIIHEITNEMGLFRQIILASDGSDAVRKLLNQEFDLVITDFVMPKADGAKLITSYREKLTKMPNGKEKADAADKSAVLPVIVVSGNLNASFIKDAASLGVKHFLAKPFKSDDLIKIVNKAMGIQAKAD